MHRFVKTLAIATPLLSSALLASNSADACGGCFVPPSSSTVVSGHRMAISISAKQTVLWDQIQYQGNPEEFSWVLPIKPGARIEEASNAWFETLEAATATVVQAPPLNCNGGGAFGCGSSSGFAGAADSAGTGDYGNGGVTVVKQETVGPYESVTLSAQEPGALTTWLDEHGYEIPDDIKPTIAAYVNDGFDFIALRLIPGNGVNLMKPVRVITDGASPVLPLRMVAAGTGAFTSVILYVLGEGRWTTENFPAEEVSFKDLKWDGDANDSNYAQLRKQTMEHASGRTWITSYARANALFSYDDEFGEGGGGLGYAYLRQIIDDEGSNYDEYSACQAQVQNANTGGLVVSSCDPEAMECPAPNPGEIDASVYACGELTDLAAALVGMHPNDVWITRLEANLPRPALIEDLKLAADASQKPVENFHEAVKSENYECPASPLGPGSVAKGGKGTPSGNGTAVVLVGLGAIAAMLAARRRRTFVSA